MLGGRRLAGFGGVVTRRRRGVPALRCRRLGGCRGRRRAPRVLERGGRRSARTWRDGGPVVSSPPRPDRAGAGSLDCVARQLLRRSSLWRRRGVRAWPRRRLDGCRVGVERCGCSSSSTPAAAARLTRRSAVVVSPPPRPIELGACRATSSPGSCCAVVTRWRRGVPAWPYRRSAVPRAVERCRCSTWSTPATVGAGLGVLAGAWSCRSAVLARSRQRRLQHLQRRRSLRRRQRHQLRKARRATAAASLFCWSTSCRAGRCALSFAGGESGVESGVEKSAFSPVLARFYPNDGNGANCGNRLVSPWLRRNFGWLRRRRSRFKNLRPHGRAGSSPASGTTFQQLDLWRLGRGAGRDAGVESGVESWL
ncbi:MAG: hypothetical protein ACK52I_11775 [Pseudomonadota bacterium]